MKKLIIPFLIIVLSISCESKQAKRDRLEREEKYRVEYEQQKAKDEKEKAIRLEQEMKEQEIYDKYISNSLQTGSMPYAKYYGRNTSCRDYGCSQIRVKTSNSDVLVTIKKNNRVVRHAFIQARDSYTFSFPDGTYQAFFYYGKGWNPEKLMKGGEIKGGFVADEYFGKDNPQPLYNSILEYELILQKNGNFSTRPSNPEEAL